MNQDNLAPPVISEEATKKISKAVSLIIIILLVVGVILPKINEKVSEEREKSAKHAALIAGFPQAACAGWEDVSYRKAFSEPIAIELSSYCYKTITIPAAYHFEWQSESGGIYIKFLGEKEPRVILGGQKPPWFEGNGSKWETTGLGKIGRVVEMSIASLPGGNGKIVISPYEIPGRKTVEVTPEMTEYTGKNLPD